jgi:hypothetical protein
VSKKQWVDFPLYRTVTQGYHVTCFFELVLPRARSYTVAPDGSSLEGFAELDGGSQAGVLGLIASGAAAQHANRVRLAASKVHKAALQQWKAATAAATLQGLSLPPRPKKAGAAAKKERAAAPKKKTAAAAVEGGSKGAKARGKRRAEEGAPAPTPAPAPALEKAPRKTKHGGAVTAAALAALVKADTAIEAALRRTAAAAAVGGAARPLRANRGRRSLREAEAAPIAAAAAAPTLTHAGASKKKRRSS